MNDKENNAEFTKNILKKTKQKNKVFGIKAAIVFVIFAMLSIYYFSPISIVSENNPLTLKTSGNINLNKSEIIKIGKVENKSLFFINKNDLRNNLSNYPLIKDDSVNIKITPFHLNVSFFELMASAKFQDKYYLTDMTEVDSTWTDNSDQILSNHLLDEMNTTPSFIDDPASLTYDNDYYFYYLSVINHLSTEKRSQVVYIKPCDSSFFYYYLNYHNQYYRIKITHLKNGNTALYSAEKFFSDEALNSFEKYFKTNNNSIDEVIQDETIKVHPLVCGKFFDENNQESIYNSCNEELIKNG